MLPAAGTTVKAARPGLPWAEGAGGKTGPAADARLAGVGRDAAHRAGAARQANASHRSACPPRRNAGPVAPPLRTFPAMRCEGRDAVSVHAGRAHPYRGSA